MSVEIYKNIVSPFLDKRDSETWQKRAVGALHFAEFSPLTLKVLELFNEKHKRFKDERLRVVLGNVEFENPIIVAAGWDKNGVAVKGLYALGAAGVEVGSVPYYPQPGNLKPRQFMLGHGVALNRRGFDTDGAEVVGKNLEGYQKSNIPIGVSVTKNKEIPNMVAPEMFAAVIGKLYPYASYFALGISSPNTPDLRKLQGKGPLIAIAQAVNSKIKEMGGGKDVYIKIAPDLTNDEVNDVILVAFDYGFKVIAVNTTINSDLKAKYGERWRNEEGGLSGDDQDYRRMATEKVAHIYRETNGKMEIIGVGGVKDATTALEKIRAGAKAVQVLTAIRGEGPTVAGKINRGLVEYMKKEGIKNISELVGIDVKK